MRLRVPALHARVWLENSRIQVKLIVGLSETVGRISRIACEQTFIDFIPDIIMVLYKLCVFARVTFCTPFHQLFLMFTKRRFITFEANRFEKYNNTYNTSLREG